eukprot:CAMPEP_0172421792 /NCGR_PEP_ID=MMETSP1064-20121228/8017_1 /TAXON_ID=202472 /ORGANISM="Aulacoseira subarctica , Strain CCAP 1002/5" /LENGTH=607 /DNA_ID=CAMNT_0013162365 /DNA_START=9 /DNA_END=1832 /DNA_ORIENTATION=-
MQPLSVEGSATPLDDKDDLSNGSYDDEDDLVPLLPKSSEDIRRNKASVCSQRDTKKNWHRMLHQEEDTGFEFGSTSFKKSSILSFSLFTTLMSFWALDSIKDSVLAVLSRDLKRCQPQAKMASVVLTLILICGSEFVSHERRRRLLKKQIGLSRVISPNIFYVVGCPYFVVFLAVSLCLHFHPELKRATNNLDPSSISNNLSSVANTQVINDLDWRVLGFFQYMAIESYGSISVAAFWSFTNSRFDTVSAGKYYGLIISAAQVGAVCGATFVSNIGKTHGGMTLVFEFCAFLVLLNMLTMKFYDKRYPDQEEAEFPLLLNKSRTRHHLAGNNGVLMRPVVESSSPGSVFFSSGLFLIVKHNYVLFILGLSCLFEVPMTCLDYYMKLGGLAKFQAQSNEMIGSEGDKKGGFAERALASFMGQFGILTNLLSLPLSCYGFPVLIRRIGLRHTIRIFPTVLLCVTILIFVAKPNLWLVFFTLAFLKSLIYSIHGPATEILYIPTSNTIKLKAKFWIDVFGNRCAKALGSSITMLAAQIGGADHIAAYATAPSIVAGVLLLTLSIKIGDKFENLIGSSEIIGREDEIIEDENLWNEYQKLCTNCEGDGYYT